MKSRLSKADQVVCRRFSLLHRDVGIVCLAPALGIDGGFDDDAANDPLFLEALLSGQTTGQGQAIPPRRASSHHNPLAPSILIDEGEDDEPLFFID